jgi:hypothetical protein
LVSFCFRNLGVGFNSCHLASSGLRGPRITSHCPSLDRLGESDSHLQVLFESKLAGPIHQKSPTGLPKAAAFLSFRLSSATRKSNAHQLSNETGIYEMVGSGRVACHVLRRSERLALCD